jgi:hypothetical protein
MRIAICHNYFRERGGEDQVFEDELELLTSHGHDVAAFIRHNNDVSGLTNTMKVAIGTPWHFAPGEPHDLAQVAATVFDPENDLTHIRQNTRHKYLKDFTAGPNYDRMIEIYEETIKRRNDQQENT